MYRLLPSIQLTQGIERSFALHVSILWLRMKNYCNFLLSSILCAWKTVGIFCSVHKLHCNNYFLLHLSIAEGWIISWGTLHIPIQASSLLWSVPSQSPPLQRTKFGLPQVALTHVHQMQKNLQYGHYRRLLLGVSLRQGKVTSSGWQVVSVNHVEVWGVHRRYTPRSNLVSERQQQLPQEL